MAWQPLPAAEYSPDLPDLDNPGSGNIRNVIPRTSQSYGPFPALVSYGTALTKRAQGALTVTDSSANVYVFAGDANDLYDYTSASTAPNNLSSSAGAYNCTSDGQWKLALFGQRVVASDFSDAMQSYVLQSSSKFADLANGGVLTLAIAVPGNTYTNGTNYALVATGGGGSGFAGLVDVVSGHFTNARITAAGHGYTSAPTITLPAGAGAGDGTASITAAIATIAPKARYIDVVKDFLVAANTNDASGGNQPQRVWWSAANDPANWPTPGTAAAAAVQSSYNDLLGNGGWIQGIIGNLGTADGAVFLEREVWRMVYAGPPAVFNFFPAEGVRGTPAPNSLIHVGAYVYYLGPDGFYVFDGTTSKPIGVNKVDKTFFALLQQNSFNRIWGSYDPINKIVYWAFPSVNSAGNCDYILAYNWQFDKWSIINSGSEIEIMFPTLTFGVTLDTMNLGTLDAMPQLPLDSRAFTGGNLLLSAFFSDHTLQYYNGSSLAATIETSEQELFPGYLAFVRDTRPLVDGGTPSVALAARNRQIDSYTYRSTVSINSIGTCPQTANGRYVRGKVTIPSASTWTHFLGLNVDAVPNGVQ